MCHRDPNIISHVYSADVDCQLCPRVIQSYVGAGHTTSVSLQLSSPPRPSATTAPSLFLQSTHTTAYNPQYPRRVQSPCVVVLQLVDDASGAHDGPLAVVIHGPAQLARPWRAFATPCVAVLLPVLC